MVITTAAAAACDVPVRGRRSMVWRRTFRGVAEQAHDAREFVRFLLADAPVVDDIVQVAAELIANAITHTRSGAPGGLYMLEVHRWRGGAALSVLDQGGPSEPRLGSGELAEHGYGLRTVKAMATWWTWRGNAQGRTVIAVFVTDRTCDRKLP
jgi:serine/threonine-protein kinase RsbW